MLHSDAIRYDILTCRENFKSNESIKCILMLFDTIFWLAEKVLKAMKLNCAFWRYLIQYFDLERNLWKQWNWTVHSGAFWDLCLMSFSGDAPDPLVNYILLFISASDILNCAISWFYQIQNVCVCMKSFLALLCQDLWVLTPSHPWSSIFIAFLGSLFFWLSREGCTRAYKAYM